LKPLKTIRAAQKSAKMSRAGRIETRIGHILATEEELVPSSGFVVSVMERVQEEAAAPPPIPFPWKLAVPAILLVAGVFAWGTNELLRRGVAEHGLPELPALTLSSVHLTSSAVHSLEEAGWVALALVASLLSCLLARRLAGRGGLL
jgi:hypothetical protein